MRLEEVTRIVDGLPYMTPDVGGRIYAHVREARPDHVLELDTAYGVGAAYMAAALDANRHGHLTTVDYSLARFDPDPRGVLSEAGLAHRVELVRDFSGLYLVLEGADRAAI